MVYADGGELALNTGVIPYDLNTPLFSDYAHKLRTIWMPPGMAAIYDANATFEFPVGTVITKTFYYPRPAGAVRDSNSVARSYDQSADFVGHASRAAGLNLAKVRLIETRILVRREHLLPTTVCAKHSPTSCRTKINARAVMSWTSRPRRSRR